MRSVRACLVVLILSSSALAQPQPVRLQAMATPDVLGRTPTPTAEELKEYARYVGRIIDPRNTLDLVVGRTRLMVLKQAPSRIQVADPAMMEANALSPRQVTLLGRRVGTTVLTLYFKGEKEGEKPQAMAYLVRSLPDPEVKGRLAGRTAQGYIRPVPVASLPRGR